MNVREVVEAVHHLLAAKGYAGPFDNDAGVSQRQIADALDRDASVISRNVAKAVDQGFLKDLAGGQGRESRLVKGERALPTGSALPDPASLNHRDDLRMERERRVVDDTMMDRLAMTVEPEPVAE